MNDRSNQTNVAGEEGTSVREESELDRIRTEYHRNLRSSGLDVKYNALQKAISRPLSETITPLLEGESLFDAIRQCDCTMVELLLVAGADPNARHRTGCTPLVSAIVLNRTKIVDILLKFGSDPNGYSGNVLPLGAAVYMNNMDVVRNILKHDADVNLRNGFGTPVLHLCARSVTMTNLLLNHGANPNGVDNHGETPLHWAVSIPNPSTIDVLLLHGAIVTANFDGETPLHEAIRGGTWR